MAELIVVAAAILLAGLCLLMHWFRPRNDTFWDALAEFLGRWHPW